MRTSAQEKLDTLAAICGKEHLDAALDCAIEAAKLGLSAEDLTPRVRSYHYLELAGAQPKDSEGFIAWSARTGLVSQEQWAQAEEIDLLGMKDA